MKNWEKTLYSLKRQGWSSVARTEGHLQEAVAAFNGFGPDCWQPIQERHGSVVEMATWARRVSRAPAIGAGFKV